MCTERTNQGLGLLHHKINPADICAAQQKTSRFRREGRQIFCVTDDETVPRDRKVGLAEFCRKNYGPTAIVSKRLTDNQPLCTVKGAGGLSQTHHAIDLAQLCRTGGKVSPGAVDGDTLDCAKSGGTSGAGSAGNASSGNGAGRGRPRPGEQALSGQKQAGAGAQVPDTAVIPITDKPDLTSCGVPAAQELRDFGYEKEYAAAHQLILDQSKLMALYVGFEKKSEAEQRAVVKEYQNSPVHWMSGSVPLPCPGLSGGFELDLNEVCRTLYANPDPNFVFWLPSGRPVCHPTDWSSGVPDSRTIDAIATFGLNLYFACAETYPDRSALRFRLQSDAPNKKPGILYPILKFSGRKAECFYLELPTPDISAAMD